jgi:hypothetical protein
MNRAEATKIIEKIRAFGISDTQLIDSLFDNILSSPTSYNLAIDLAEEFDVDAVEEEIDFVEEEDDDYDDEIGSTHGMTFGY